LENTPSSSTGRSISDIPRSVLISGVGAIVLLISVFMNWYSASVSASGGLSGFGGASRSISGWDATDVAKLVALLALVAIAAWVIELFVPDVTLPVPAWMIAGGAGALSVLLVLYRIISKPGGAHSFSFTLPNASIHVDIGTAFGIWLALIAAIATVVGAYLRMNEPA
jgi:hypothetical protein